MSSISVPKAALAELQNAPKTTATSPALVGLDGFVDKILHVVAKRESAEKYTRLSKMTDWSKRIAAAAGLSANFEMVTKMVKLGGNGPIMANALGAFGMPITYIGNLGDPNIHPIFHDFAKRNTVYSIAEPGYTDAVEFDDGKLMLGKHEALPNITWKNLTSRIGLETLTSTFQNSSLVALVNWTMIPHMSEIFTRVLSQIAPKLTGARRWVFFDLADPSKRTMDDIASVLNLITRFQKQFNTILGLNLNEGHLAAKVLGIRGTPDTPKEVAVLAGKIREKLDIETVVIHPTKFAAAATASGQAHLNGPFIAKPLISTGGGDHFNAGFCLGHVLNAPLEVALQLAVCTSGFYVRNAKSPTIEDLRRFLKTL
jgi:hypothetical protein